MTPKNRSKNKNVAVRGIPSSTASIDAAERHHPNSSAILEIIHQMSDDAHEDNFSKKNQKDRQGSLATLFFSFSKAYVWLALTFLPFFHQLPEHEILSPRM